MNPATQLRSTQEIVIEENQLKYVISDKISPVTLYELIDSRNVLVITKSIAEKELLPNVLFPVKQKSINEIPLLYDCKVINVLCSSAMTGNNYDGYANETQTIPYVCYNVKPELLKRLNSEEFLLSNGRFNTLHDIAVSIDLLLDYGTNVLQPITESISIDSLQFKYFDVSGFSPRNIAEMASKIVNDTERNAAIVKLRKMYAQVNSPNLNDYFLDPNDSIPANYTSFTLPIFLAERHLLNMGLMFMRDQYVTPMVACQNANRYTTSRYIVDGTDVRRLLGEPTNIRYPKGIASRIDLKLAYIIPTVIKEFINEIDISTHVAIQVAKYSDSYQSFTTAMGINFNRTSASEEILSYLNDGDLGILIQYFHKANINPNLYRLSFQVVNGHSLTYSSFEDFPCAISILIMQVMFPAVVFSRDDRVLINNSLCRFIIAHMTSQRLRDNLDNYSAAAGVTPIPQGYATHSWSTDTDYLFLLYTSYYNTVSGDRKGATIIRLIQAYYNNVGTIEMLQKGQQYSIEAPYQLGRAVNNRPINTDNDDVRAQMGFPLGGAALLQAGDNMSVYYNRKMDIAAMLVDSHLEVPTSYSTSAHCRNVIGYLKSIGTPNFCTAIQHYNYFSTKYNLSVCTDNSERDVSLCYKEQKALPFFSAITIPIRIAAGQPFMQSIAPTFMDGTTTLCSIVVFHAFHALVKRIFDGAGDFNLVASQVKETAQRLTAKVLGRPKYDAQAEFGFNSADVAGWNRFLNTPPSEHCPTFNAIYAAITNFRNVTQSLRQQDGICKRFFIVKSALTGRGITGNGLPIIGANTVISSRIKSKHIITGFTDYCRLVNAVRKTDAYTMDDELSNKIHSLKETDTNGLLSGDYIEAIEITMPCVVDLNIIYEKGDYSSSGFKYMRYDQLLEDMRVTMDYKRNINPTFNQPNVCHIPITVALNDLGENLHRKPISTERQRTYYSELSRAQVIVALDDLAINCMPFRQFLDTCKQDMVMRNGGFDIKPSTDINFIKVDSAEGSWVNQ